MHSRPTRLSLAATAAALVVAGLARPALTSSASAYDSAQQKGKARPELRFATFNASLNRINAGDLVRDLSTPDNAQAAAIAETIQRVDPDVVLVNEFDYVEGGRAAELFRDNYLEVAHNGAAPVDYPYYYVAPVEHRRRRAASTSTTTASSARRRRRLRLRATSPASTAWSSTPSTRSPTDDVRTFQHFLWKDMPGALLPDDPATPAKADWYSPAELDVFRLSSKSHWDVPIKVPGRKPVHFLVSHPTPPTFDGPEDRNGTRNHDEIRFWADYVSGGRGASYIYDDAGETGGLGRGQDFVIAGDQNADPFDGDSVDRAIQQLLDHPRIQDPHPTSAGAVEATQRDGGANLTHRGPAAEDTADFADTTPGNLRADYVLPSERLDDPRLRRLLAHVQRPALHAPDRDLPVPDERPPHGVAGRPLTFTRRPPAGPSAGDTG